MPFIGILHLLIAIGFVIHANKTGRPQHWMFILLFVPLVGSIAYIAFELLPEWAGSRRARKVATNICTVVDPDRDFRNLGAHVRESDTVDAKIKFAEECERKGMWPEAITVYEHAAQGFYEGDADVLRRLARAKLGNGDPAAALVTLDELRAGHPQYEHQDAHLTYARALEGQNRQREAAKEYHSLAGYFIGLEAKTRYAGLLEQMGDEAAARDLYAEVVKTGKTRTAVLTDEDHDWLRLARKKV